MSRASFSIIFVGLAVALLLDVSHAFALQAPFLAPEPTVQDRQMLESSHQFARQINAAEWLGPLAPIALSPFFGLACLSGIATYGPEWLQERSSMFSASSPLNNPALFWSMVVLTFVTSIPRLSKVSKPFALAVEKLETYSVVIIVIMMRMFAHSDDATSEGIASAAPIYLSAGFASFPIDTAFSIAAAINILVINGVKLFCEFLVWLSPIPFVDAAVEAANKGLCVGLMGLYCWSPMAATLVNLVMLAVCGFLYFSTQRRIVYYLDILFGPLAIRWLPGWITWNWQENADGEAVFLAHRWNGIPKLTAMRLTGSSNDGWRLTRRRWWSRAIYTLAPCRPEVKAGWLATSIHLSDGHLECVELHRRSQVKRVVPMDVVVQR